MKSKTADRMNIVVRCLGLAKPSVWRQLAETQIRRLQSLAQIATARVTLEWQRGVKPAFRVLTLLEVPGPDFHAEASDNTLQAALLKVIRDLERQIRSRQHRRVDNRKTKLQLGLNPSRVCSGPAGAKI